MDSELPDLDLDTILGDAATARKSGEKRRALTAQAVSIGVIVNELVSNACKYAYDPGTSGEVRISLRREGENRFELHVEDDGRGLAESAAPRGTGLGRRLMGAMAHSLKAELVYEPKPVGVHAILRAAI